MTYSCALFDQLPGRTPQWPDLAVAQRRKIDHLLDVAGVRRGSRVLEIGTGWGELAIRAAARGAHVRSVTLRSSSSTWRGFGLPRQGCLRRCRSTCATTATRMGAMTPWCRSR